jgi:hypothetical protein
MIPIPQGAVNMAQQRCRARSMSHAMRAVLPLPLFCGRGDYAVLRPRDRNNAASVMAQDGGGSRPYRYGMVLVGIIILLIFLYFYQPFEKLVSESIRGLAASTIIFWFAAFVGVIAYAIAHWQSYRQHVFRDVKELDAEALVYDTVQIAILVALILCAGGILQVIEMLGAHLIRTGSIIDASFGRKLLAIVLLVILAIGFYLLHRMVRSFRIGWRPRRAPRSVDSSRRPAG